MTKIKFILLLLANLNQTVKGILFLTKEKFKKFKPKEGRNEQVEKEQRQVLAENPGATNEVKKPKFAYVKNKNPQRR